MLIPEWRNVLLKGWSARVIIVGIVADLILELFGSDLPPFASLGISVLALYLRVRAQTGAGFTLPEKDHEQTPQK